MTAEKVWEFVHPDSLYGSSTGSIQRLPNGNTLINWGNLTISNLGAIFTEVDSTNQIVFQLECIPGENTYRVHKFDWFFDSSIVGCANNTACNYNPNVIIEDSSCYFHLFDVEITETNNTLSAQVNDGVPPYSYLWSNNEITPNISPNNNGLYWLIVQDVNQCFSDTIFYNFNISIINQYDNSSINGIPIKIFNSLGQEVNFQHNTILFYLYPNGEIRKQYFIKP